MMVYFDAGGSPAPPFQQTEVGATTIRCWRAPNQKSPAQTLESQFSDRYSASRNYSMRTWSLFSDGSSLTPALRSLPDFSSIEAEAGVWLVHNPVTFGLMFLKE